MKAQMHRMKGLKQASGELVTGLRISIDLEDDEIVLLIRLLLKHVIEFQEGDWRILTPFESRLIRKLESVRQDAIKSLNQGRNHNANEPDNSHSQTRGLRSEPLKVTKHYPSQRAGG